MNIDREMYRFDNRTMMWNDKCCWLKSPSLTSRALLQFLAAIELESRYVHIFKPVNREVCLRKFFGIPEETDSFVKFMFDLSLTHEIAVICKDEDPCGERNLLLVIRESTDKTNVDGEIIDAILRKFEDTKGLV